MGLKLITPPASYPVTLEEAKAQLNVDFDDDDTLISLMIGAATAAIEQELERCLKPQTWDYYLDEFPESDHGIRLPLPPLMSVDGVFYVSPDTSLEVELVEGTDFEIDYASARGWVVPAADTGWPTPKETANAVRVRFEAGYADSDDSPLETTVPLPIRQAILLMVRDHYDNRGTFVVGAPVSQIPAAINRLIGPYRAFTL